MPLPNSHNALRCFINKRRKVPKPTITVSAPSNVTAGSVVTLTASTFFTPNGIDTIASVQFRVNGINLNALDTTPPYSTSWVAPSTPGVYSITAVATGNKGGSTTSQPVLVQVEIVSNQPPTVTLSAPSTAVVGTPIILSATAADSDGTIAKVEFFNGATKLGEDSVAPYSISYTFNSATTASLKAVAIDNQGATTDSNIITCSVNVSGNQLPTVTLSAPTTATANSPITLSATAADIDGSVVKVEFFNGATKLGEDTEPPFSISYTFAAATTAVLKAIATDNQGGTTESNNITCTVGEASGATTTVYQIVWLGQSNSSGNMETTPLRVLSTANYHPDNRMLNTGVRASDTGNTALVGLVESDSADPNSAGQFLGETGAAGCLAWLRQNASLPANSILVATNWAQSGFRYSQLAKGTTPYNLGLAQVQAVKNICQSLGYIHKVIALVNIHGETDQTFSVANYSGNLLQWQTDLETDYKTITGQSESIPMFCCQQNGYSPSAAASQSVATAIELYKAHKANPTKIVLVAPRYQYSYHNALNATIHLTAHDQRWHGEIYARAIARHVFQAQNFRPLMPTSVTMATGGTTIDVVFNVPTPPIVFDLQNVIAPSNTALGFEYFDESTPPAITNVELLNSTTIRITLAAVPTGTNRELRYAYTSGNGAGRLLGARGNIADSANPISNYDYPLKNFAVQFAESITLT